jgi:lysyl-tRNA synthetase class 2
MARVFRDGDISPTHSPEFTMLEWYRAGATYTNLMDDTEALFAACGETRPVERLSVAEAFRRHAGGLDILGTVSDPFAAEPLPEALKAAAAAIGVYVGEGDGWEDAFFHIFLDRIEPRLGLEGPVILYDWPACMAALSRRKPSDPRVCERFEVYVNGLELANAFGELTDPAEQRRRFEHSMQAKQRLYGAAAVWPVEEDFLAALEHGLPDPCAGIALGVDRLVMVLTGAQRIEDVLWAPVA